LITAEKIDRLKSIGFDFYVYHTNRTAKIDAYLKSNPSKKHPALDLASKEDVTESTGEVENRDLDVASTSDAAESTGKAIKSNLPGELIILMQTCMYHVSLYTHTFICFIHRCSNIVYAN